MKKPSSPHSLPFRLPDPPVADLPGLSDTDQTQLVNCGICTVRQLWQQTRTAAQKQKLAGQLQMHVQHVNKWAALADLAQIPTVGCQYCGLLLHAGISSSAQLAQTSLPRLHRQVLKLQVAMMQRQDLCPSLEQVAQWIQQAQQISRQAASRGTRTSP
jgi:Domain of unknown function (DUF4332)